MKVAIAKPDYGARGGFEIVVERLAGGLRKRGHAVDLVTVDATADSTSHLPLPVTPDQLRLFQEFFFHLNLIARFEELDVSGYDVVLCTQPGSYAVRHPRKVVLFYHHTRSFYDLQVVIESVRGHDIDLHQLATFVVHDVDNFFLTPDVPILAGSHRVKQRLADHNGLHENVEVFSAGIDEAFLNFNDPITFQSPVCIQRHEFPKRTELFIHAMNHVQGLSGRVVGIGSFTERLKGMDAWLRAQHIDREGGPIRGGFSCFLDDDKLWRHYMIHLPAQEFVAARAALARYGATSPVTFVGRVSKTELLREYASALCVVCPAFDEDYGLTCIEAMACGKPVIACDDGGGYVELIEDGVDGFIVTSTGPAIARAIERLKDATLARKMGECGREKARAYTWERAIDQLERALIAACRSGS